MSEFFKPWRRKVGCVTLAMACVFMAGWVRSRTANDYVLIPTNSAGYFVGADSHGLCWIQSQNLDFPDFWYVVQGPGVSFEFNAAYQRPLDHNAAATCSQWLGFQIIQINSNILGPRSRELKWVLPYWSIVLPLTLLSAYLLLSKQSPINRGEPPTAEWIA